MWDSNPWYPEWWDCEMSDSEPEDSDVEERYEEYLDTLPAEEREYLEQKIMRGDLPTLRKLKKKKNLRGWKRDIRVAIILTPDIKGVMEGTEKPPEAKADEGLKVKKRYRVRQMKAFLMILTSLNEDVLGRMEVRGYRDDFKDPNPKRLFEFACTAFDKIDEKSEWYSYYSGSTRITPRGSVTKPSSKSGSVRSRRA
jgi:hypothetical protein